MGIVWGALGIPPPRQAPVGAVESSHLGVLSVARLSFHLLLSQCPRRGHVGSGSFCAYITVDLSSTPVEFLLYLAEHMLDLRSTDLTERWALRSLLGHRG